MSCLSMYRHKNLYYALLLCDCLNETSKNERVFIFRDCSLRSSRKYVTNRNGSSPLIGAECSVLIFSIIILEVILKVIFHFKYLVFTFW